MEYYAGIDISLESASLCVIDAARRIVREYRAWHLTAADGTRHCKL